LYQVEMTGQEILGFLEYSYGEWFSTLTPDSEHLLRFSTDENGDQILNKAGRPLLSARFYNFDTAAGIRYEVDLTKEPGKRITILSLDDGSRFDPKKVYRVAMNSYRANGGGGHMTMGAGIPDQDLKSRVIWVSEQDMRAILAGWLKNRGTYTSGIPNNWKLLPVDQVKSLVSKDYMLLFGEE
jgi:2',3'-cyclic-nucleotide 2'-phosphodiesterase / 3'-nucleotidase